MSFLDGLLGSPNVSQATNSSVSAATGASLFLTAPSVVRTKSGQFKLSSSVCANLAGSTSGGISIQFFSSLTGAIGPTATGGGVNGSAASSIVWIDSPSINVGQSITYSVEVSPTNASTSITLPNKASSIVVAEEGGAPSGSGVIAVSTSGGGGGGGGGALSSLASPFTMPAVGSTVIASMIPGGGAAFQKNNAVNVNVSGAPSNFTVTLVSGDNVTLLNNGGPFNVAPAGTVPAASIVTVASTNAPIGAAAPAVGTSLVTDTTGTYQNVGLRPRVNPQSYGAKCDCKFTAQVGQMTSGANTLTLSSGTPFAAGDVGKHITVTGAGAAGVDLHTTISGFVSSSSVTTTANAGTTVPNAAAFPPVQKAWVEWGTDDSTAAAAAISASEATAPGRVLYVPASMYLVSQQTIPTNVALECEEGAVIHSEATLNVWGRVKAHDCQQIFSMPTQVSFLHQTSSPWTAPVTNIVHSGWWGAVGDNATDNTVALRSGLLAAGSVANTALSGVGGTFQFGFGWYQITDSLTVSQFATGVAGLHIRGHNKGASGGSDNTVLVMNFVEPSGTSASLSSSGVLTTSGGDPAWQASDVGTWVYIKNGQAMAAGFDNVANGRPAVTCSQAVSAPHQVKVRILTGGAQGVATFQVRNETSGWSTFTTSATPTSFLGFTITTPVGNYLGNLSLIASGTSPPAVTLTSTLQSTLELWVKVSTAGVLAAAQVQVSTDKGNTFAASQAIAGGSLVVTYPSGTVTINFPSGTYGADNVWKTTDPHNWFFATNQGAWQITQFNSATSVNITHLSFNTDPTLSFMPATESGLNWAHPTRTGLRIWSRDCIVSDLAIQPANGLYCYAGAEDTQGDVSVACTNNEWRNVSITVLAAGSGTGLVHGFSHGDNPATPGRNVLATNCDNNRYIKCSVSLTAFAAFYNPNRSGQAYALCFDQCTFTGGGTGNLNLRCCIYYFSGTFKSTNGCNWGSARDMIATGTSSFLVNDIMSEHCDRIVHQPLQFASTVTYTFTGGRIDPTGIAEDGYGILVGGGTRMNLFGLAIDPEPTPYWKSKVYNSSTIRGVSNYIGCTFPCDVPIFHPAPGSGNASKVTLAGCAGTEESGTEVELTDVAGALYGP